MALSLLPAELRLRIYEYLPDLAPGRFETVGATVRLTPTICRVSQQIRKETLPIYVRNAHFNLQTDSSELDGNLISSWLQALGNIGLENVRSIQLSRHWHLSQPARWQGHIGFYVRLERTDDVWQCTAGTYPIAKDMRGMRLESVELLQHVIQMNVLRALSLRDRQNLERDDVGMLVKAMEIVAHHPISAFDTEQSEMGRKRRRVVWAEMERELLALELGSEKVDDRLAEGARTFHTPY